MSPTDTAVRAAPGTGQVTLLGIRHHGPGSARAVVRALRELQPDVILIEGPPEADELVRFAADETLQPPVALLAYVNGEPRKAAFWPYAVFSPEWQAIRYGVANDVPVQFCDLPAVHQLAMREEKSADDEQPDEPAGPVDSEPSDRALSEGDSAGTDSRRCGRGSGRRRRRGDQGADRSDRRAGHRRRLRRRGTLVGRRDRAPARRRTAVPGDGRGDGGGTGGSPGPAARAAGRGPRGVHAGRAAARPEGRVRADRRGVRGLARAGALGAYDGGRGHRAAQGSAEGEGVGDLGAVDARPAGLLAWLRRRGQFTGLVPPPVHHRRPCRTPLAGRGGPGAARGGRTDLQRARDRGGTPRRGAGHAARSAARRVGRADRGDPVGDVRRQRGAAAARCRQADRG